MNLASNMGRSPLKGVRAASRSFRPSLALGLCAAAVALTSGCGSSSGTQSTAASGGAFTPSGSQTSASTPTPTASHSRTTTRPKPTVTGHPTGPGRLIFSPQKLSPGDPSFDLINVGATPVKWKAFNNNGMLALNPSEGTVPPGGFVIVTLTYYFPNHDVYNVSTTVDVNWNGQTTPVPMSGRYDVGPYIEDYANPLTEMCPGRLGNVTVAVSDLEDVASVHLIWTELSSGSRTTIASGNVPMTQYNGGNAKAGHFVGTIGPLPSVDPGTDGLLYWHVAATDGGGLETDGDTQSIPLAEHC